MIDWNVVGAFIKPNGMTKNSKWPLVVLNVVLNISFGTNRI